MKLLKHLFLGFSLFTLIFSCSKSDKAVSDYCNCMNKVISDSLISTDIVNEQHVICFDSITNKYKLNEDTEFKENFDSLNTIKDLKVNINYKISENIDNILQTYMWEFKDLSSLNYKTYELRRYYFDGKMFKQELYGMNYGIRGWELFKTWTGIYKIEIEKNGSIYVNITFDDNSNDIFKFRKSKKDGFYLDGKRTLWQEKK